VLTRALVPKVVRSITSFSPRNWICSAPRGGVELSQILGELLQDERLRCGAVIDEFGQVLIRVGDFESYPAPSLVSSLLGPSGRPHAAYASLEGQALPQIWGEGEYFAFIDRPVPGFAFVLFGVPARSRLAFLRPRSGVHEANTLLEYSKRVSLRLREALAR
jgi:hypothetical protein